MDQDKKNQAWAMSVTGIALLILLTVGFCTRCSLFEDEEDHEITYTTIPTSTLLYEEGRCCELCATNSLGNDLRCVTVCPCPLDEDEQTDEEE